MSPRRRALLVATVGLALVVMLAVVLTHRGGPRLIGAYPPQDRPGPVLLVPGYGGSTASLEVLARRLQAAGREATVVALPGDGTGDLRTSAKTLDAAADRALAGGAPSVDVIGYSAGGVVVRAWVRDLGGDRKARRVITLGSPHHGTKLAALGSVLVPGACPAACQQLVPGSSLLKHLNSGDETPPGPQWLSVWTSQDETVTPPDSAHLDGAVDVVLQSLCPGVSVAHSDLPGSPLVGTLVLAALQAGPVVPPRPGC